MLHLLILYSLALALVNGLVLPSGKSGNGAQPLRLDFTISKTVGDLSAREFWASKRDAYKEDIVDYRDITYHIDIFLGSDKQKSTVILDTGSSDLWVPSSGYDPATSITSENTGQNFTIGYLDGTGSEGVFYKDTIQFRTDELQLPSFQFAKTTRTSGFGTLGIADRNQETSAEKYDNLPWALQKAGIIPKASYSLFLGPEGESGSLIFGGIDTAKYHGSLKSYNVDSSLGGLGVLIKSVTFNNVVYAVNKPAFLDSGTSLGLLSSELMDVLDNMFDTSIKDIGGIQYREVSCDQPTDKNLIFSFGENTIILPYSEAIFNQGDGTCLLGFGWYNDYMILGDVFLRQAYVHYDLTDQKISLAQASYSTSSNIISD